MGVSADGRIELVFTESDGESSFAYTTITNQENFCVRVSYGMRSRLK